MPRYQRPSSVELAQQKAQRAMVEGVGGLQFVAQSPPGLGRLIRIPFYLEVAAAGFVALDPNALANAADIAAAYAAGSASNTHPVISFAPPAAAGAGATATVTTPQISWATLRIVGFESIVYEPILPAVPMMQLAYQQLQIGGGASLFVHQDFAPASIYLAGQQSFAGLRDYPLLKSPNTATVQVQAVGDGTGVAPGDAVAFSSNLVCEILTDDNYGSHVPGPYARPGALVRQGGSFVS